MVVEATDIYFGGSSGARDISLYDFKGGTQRLRKRRNRRSVKIQVLLLVWRSWYMAGLGLILVRTIWLFLQIGGPFRGCLCSKSRSISNGVEIKLDF